MFKFLIFLILLTGSSLFVTEVFSLEIELQPEGERQREEMGWLLPERDPLQEQMQLVIDRITHKNKVSIGWLSSNPNDIKLTHTLENVSSNPKIVSLTITNQFACAPTQIDKACVIIEVEREGLGDNISEITKNAREITDKILLTVEGDTILYSEPEFYSTIIKPKIGFDGVKSFVSKSVYTIGKTPTEQIFPILSTTILSEDIRTSGGFYDNAVKLSEDYFSEYTLSIVPLENHMLRTLHISWTCSDEVRELPPCDEGNIFEQIRTGYISPLDFIDVEKIHRSKIFADQFLPLNSVIQVLIYSNENLQVKSVNSNLIETLSGLGDIQESGWFFVSAGGKEIDARYIFGKEFSVSKNSLAFSIGAADDSPVIKIEVKTPNDGNELFGQDGGGCLIATAAFGSELAPQIQLLREIRDNTVLQTESGSIFMTGFNQFYYSFSPMIADYERESPIFKEAMKLTLTPLLTSLTLLQYADIDSESEMFGYGISIILLNIGMYFVAPAILIMKIKKRI